jgi:hypothetical protein
MKTKTEIIKTVDNATERIEVHLMALNWLTSSSSEKYYSELAGEDIAHNMKTLFSELKTIRSLLREENETLRDHKNVLETVNMPMHPINLEEEFRYSEKA